MNKEISGGKSDIIFAVVMLVCGFLYWNLIKFVSLGAGVSIFSLILCTSLIIYFKVSGIKQSKNSLICLGIIILSTVNFFLFDNIVIKGLNFIFLSVSVVYWVCLSNGRRIDEKLSAYFLGDMINQLIIVPFSNFSNLFHGLKHLLIKNKNSKGIVSVLIGILIILPVLIVVVNLLADADAAFESLVNNIQFSFSENTIEYIIQIVLGLPVACYLYGIVSGNKYNKNTDHITIEKINKNTSALRFVPSLTSNTALSALNIIYIIFFLSQASYLFSAFVNNIPGAMTYSEYARRGFFELCTIAGINLIVLATAHMITNRKEKADSDDHQSSNEEIPKLLKIETVTLCLFTIALIFTALSKMVIYINSYGLTQLRVYTSWFMILLTFIFIIIAIRQFKTFNGSRISIISFVILFMLLCNGNIDGMIAKYNIDRYREGTLETVDVQALSQLSDAAVPYLFELYQEEDQPLKTSIKTELLNQRQQGMLENQYESSFRDFNFQKYKADKIRAAL